MFRSSTNNFPSLSLVISTESFLFPFCFLNFHVRPKVNSTKIPVIGSCNQSFLLFLSILRVRVLLNLHNPQCW